MEKFLLKTKDGERLSVHTFDIANPKAVVQIIHGMEEHQERYERFARFLNENGFAAVTSDLRGHGRSARNLGHFKDKKGYIALIKDQICIRGFIADRYPNVPVYLFAHSMGSIIGRVVLRTESEKYSKAVLSGYPYHQTLLPFGLWLTDTIGLIRGRKYKSPFVTKISVGAFNDSVAEPKTELDWLCSNPDIVRGYINDPYCGIGFTCAAFNDLYHLLSLMHKTKTYRNVNADMPILMLRGADDPCTGSERHIRDSIDTLRKAGFRHVKRIDYEGMRHEILNETDYMTVYRDIADFFEK